MVTERKQGLLANEGSKVMKFLVKKITLAALLSIAAATNTAANAFGLPSSSFKIDAGPVGNVSVQGVLSGYGVWQDNPSPSSVGLLASKHVGTAVSNAFVIVQKDTGLLQFYVQAGAYSFPQVGAPLASSRSSINVWGPLTWAYLTIAPSKNFSFEIGRLPVLYGHTSTFSYQRNSIEGGMLWGIETGLNRGIQLNFTKGPMSLSVSWNDGYYSNRYNWVDGLLTYTINDNNSIDVYGGGNLGSTGTLADYEGISSYSHNPYVNASLGLDNSDIYGIYYEYTNGPLSISPEVQVIDTPKNKNFGTTKGSYNLGVSLQANYQFSKTWSLATDLNYATASGIPGDGGIAGNFLGYGNGMHAWAFDITPTYQSGGYFIREELSLVHVSNYAPGNVFGTQGTNPTQVRAMLETGFMF
ncbi:MAG: outer membrane beta-barrel protein [Planctomycetia bacterium]|nr:outer membrane beta-barrel protein [Planctomycetia bacterium]